MISWLLTLLRLFLSILTQLFFGSSLNVSVIDSPARFNEYEKKKKVIQKQIESRNNNKGTLSISGKTTTNLFRFRSPPKSTTTRLNIALFNNVINVDSVNLTAVVEGMTTFEHFVDACLGHGVMPPVVPELKSITVGGAVSGIGIESSSFKFGFVHETVLEYEVLLSDGRVVVASKEENSDLYYGLPNSYGTLGYILRLTVQLVKTKPYVKLRHMKFTDSVAFFDELALASNDKEHSVDFIDGVSFKRNEHYLTLGTFTDVLPSNMSKPSNYTYMGIYYESIRNRVDDCLTIRDYIWRWDYDWFWNSKYFLMQVPIVRAIFGKFFLKSTVFMKIFRKFQMSGLYNRKKRELVIQDVEVPLSRSMDFLSFYYDEVNYSNEIIACWICPVRSFKPGVEYALYQMDSKQLYVNFGFWDGVAVKDKTPNKINRQIEAIVRDMKGKKSLYSTAHYTREEFWTQYNEPAYKVLRSKYDQKGVLLDLYDKTVKAQ